MDESIQVDLFVEDLAHEEFLVPMLLRIASEENVRVAHRVRSARGGHGRATTELGLYQDLLHKSRGGIRLPEVLIVGIDGNCSTFARAKQTIRAASRASFADQLVVACPDPHIERWYLADPKSFKEVVGSQPKHSRKKCQRDFYKDGWRSWSLKAATRPPSAVSSSHRSLSSEWTSIERGRTSALSRASWTICAQG